MVILQYNLYIFGIHLRTMLYQKPCYNEPCYKEVEVQLVFIIYITILYRNSIFNANSVQPDQRLQNAVSDLGLHCLPMILLGISLLNWVRIVSAKQI